MLFDIGIAGPIAGFLVAVPALFIGLAHVARRSRSGRTSTGFELGEPLLFKLASWLIWGTMPDGYSVNMHPMAFAAWFGLLATALNLFPIGQLDGGHISYAVLGRRSSHVTLAMIAVAVVLTYFSTSWLVWTGLMVVMLVRVRPASSARSSTSTCRSIERALSSPLFALVMFVALLHAGADQLTSFCDDDRAAQRPRPAAVTFSLHDTDSDRRRRTVRRREIGPRSAMRGASALRASASGSCP